MKLSALVFVPATEAGQGSGPRDEEKNMFTITARTVLNCALVIALATPFAGNAAAPVHPIAPPPPPPGSNPYQPVVENNVTGAYQYRTRILFSPPSCQNFAGQADTAFLSSALDDKTKTEQLKAIGAAAAAAGCLGP